MERKKAQLVVEEFKKQNCQRITIQDAMCMTCIMTDDREVYAIQKDNITFLAWFPNEGKKSERNVKTKICNW